MDKNTVKSNINEFGGHLKLMKVNANKYQLLVENFMAFIESHRSNMEEVASLGKSEYTCYVTNGPVREGFLQNLEFIEKN